MVRMLKYVMLGLGIYLAIPYLGIEMDKVSRFTYAFFLGCCSYFIRKDEPENQENNDG